MRRTLLQPQFRTMVVDPSCQRPHDNRQLADVLGTRPISQCHALTALRLSNLSAFLSASGAVEKESSKIEERKLLLSVKIEKNCRNQARLLHFAAHIADLQRWMDVLHLRHNSK